MFGASNPSAGKELEMTFRVHFSVDDYEDFFNVSGNTIDEIKTKVNEFLLLRGLSQNENNMWSEKLEQ
jgi:hypothetical protein